MKDEEAERDGLRIIISPSRALRARSALLGSRSFFKNLFFLFLIIASDALNAFGRSTCSLFENFFYLFLIIASARLTFLGGARAQRLCACTLFARSCARFSRIF